jgi:hypothetical protein
MERPTATEWQQDHYANQQFQFNMELHIFPILLISTFTEIFLWRAGGACFSLLPAGLKRSPFQNAVFGITILNQLPSLLIVLTRLIAVALEFIVLPTVFVNLKSWASKSSALFYLNQKSSIYRVRGNLTASRGLNGDHKHGNRASNCGGFHK